ncbi:MAG: transglycosylase domain-containing protein [Fimbriimonadaceae bacterium]
MATRSKRKKSPWVKWAKIALTCAFGTFMLGGFAAGMFVFNEFKKAEKKIERLPLLLDSIAVTPTFIYASDGTVLYRASPVYRKPILNYSEIPDTVIYATLAAEDKRFFKHDGIDYYAAARSVVTNLRSGRAAQGGSTITMQLCKRLFTKSEKDFGRKVGDVCTALQVERIMQKKEILKTYLNEIFYGHGAYGIKAAAQVYFGKSLKSLTPAEAAILARCVRRPTEENPYKDIEKATQNRNVVLRIMNEETDDNGKKWLSDTEYERAKNEPVRLQPQAFESGERIAAYPYFTHYVLDYLAKEMPDLDFKKGGYKIYTTLNPAVQDETEKAVRRVVRGNSRAGVKTAAFVLMDISGRIIAMQGGVDYQRNQFNMVSQGARQPGSSFKPFIYAAALSTGAISPGDSISNEPYTKIPGWHPENSGGKFGGVASIPTAIAQSMNLPAVWVTDKVGPETAARYARDAFGFEDVKGYMSMALGVNEVSPLQMAEGYSVFMTGGDRVLPRPILKITGKDEELVKSFQPNILKNQLDSRVANYMNDCLRGVVTGGTGKAASVIRDARGKTGTTQINKDAWFCGYTNNLVGIGWIANEQLSESGKSWVYKPMSSRTFGGTVTVNIWTQVMAKAQKIFGRGTSQNGEALERGDSYVEATSRRREQDEPPADEQINRSEEKTTTRDERTTEPETRREEAKTEPTKPEPTRPEPTRPERRDPPREEGGVNVEICAETGLKATIYCPETATRSFSPGNAPRRWCRKHSQ